jgi:eukaryotic-like serine/threonine-protein kinase
LIQTCAKLGSTHLISIPPAMSVPQSPDPWLGKFLGEQQRYRLEQSVGNGAIGDVYLTTDMRLGRRVAIKILKGALAKSKEVVARFEREISVLAALESEHIVQVLDYGITPEGHPFYVMEYLKGQTLSQLMRRSQRLSVELTVKIAVQICEGLRVAHDGVTIWKAGMTASETVKVIHRDLKPANIFMVPTAVGALVKVLDFGIAKKLYATDQPEQTNLTQAFLGTYHYAAPEQLRNARNLDERADIYSLGLILYEMLCGTDAYGISNNNQPNKEMSWAMAHGSSEPMPLRQQPGCERLPASLETAIMRCLQKAAADRFTSVAELSRALTGVPHILRTVSGSTTSLAIAMDDPTAHNPIGASSVPQDPTVARPVMPKTDLPDVTIAQVPISPEVPPADSFSDQTIAQSSSSASPDITRFQSPAQPTDRTRVQVPAADVRLDATRMQIPSRSPWVDQTLVQSPGATASTAITSPPIAPIPASRRSWNQLMIPLGIGFALGTVLMLGAYMIWRFSSRENQPTQPQPQETSSHEIFTEKAGHHSLLPGLPYRLLTRCNISAQLVETLPGRQLLDHQTGYR